MANILVIESDGNVLRLLEEVLSGEQHQVDCVNNGFKALDLIGKNDYDISIIDLELPDISGLTVLKHIREKSPQTIPFIVSAKDNINRMIKSVRIGAYDVFRKPFDIDEIIRAAGDAISEREKMIKADYAYKYAERNNTKPKAKTLIKLTSNIIVLALALLSGFFIQLQVFEMQRIPMLFGFKEIAYLIFSFICCYSYAFIRNQQNMVYCSKKRQYLNVLKVHTAGYIIFGAILFFITGLYEARLAIFAGYLIGIGALYLNTFYLVPYLVRFYTFRREGTRILTLKRFAQRVQKQPEIPNTVLDFMQNKTAANEPEINNEYNHKSSLVEDFKGERNLVRFSRKKHKIIANQ